MSELQGIDISAWQHPKDVAINWKQVRDDGIDFVMIKSDQGETYVNPYLAEDTASAHAAGVLVGVYHYAEPAPGNAELEALHAIAAVHGLPLSLGIALDLEENGSVASYELAQWAQDFLRHITEAGHIAPLYSNGEYLSMMAGSPFGHRLWFAGTDVPTGMKPWMQQSGTREVKGIVGPVDSDRLLVARGVNPSEPVAAPKHTATAKETPKAVEEPQAPPAAGSDETAGTTTG